MKLLHSCHPRNLLSGIYSARRFPLKARGNDKSRSGLPNSILFLLCFFLILSGCAARGGVSSEVRANGGNAAQVASIPITAEELNEAVKDELKGIETQIYEIKQARLTQLIEDKLWALEAKRKNVSLPELRAEAERGAEDEIRDDEVRNFFDQSQGRFGASYEASKAQVRELLIARRRIERRQSFLASLREKYPVQVFLTPPRFSIQLETSPIRGNREAPVTIVEFSDFECPFCSSVQPALQEVRKQYSDQVRFAFKHFPLPFHSKARAAHLAALCAEESGKFWEYRDRLFENQRALERTDLIRYAEELGIPSEPFKTCLDQEKYQFRIDQDLSEGLRSGVNGTPSFFVNGRPLTGGKSAAEFRQIIEGELGKNKP